MANYTKLVILLCTLVLSDMQMQAQKRMPIINMHLHARTADYYGPPPLPMCAPVERMPLWDAGAYLEKLPPCKNPIWSPKTDEELMRQTISVMQRYNSGLPDRRAFVNLLSAQLARYSQAAPQFGRYASSFPLEDP
jgi:hypothetical protein